MSQPITPRVRAGRHVSRVRLTVLLLALIAVILPTQIASASSGGATTAAPKPTIVLVHGAWADGSSFDAVTAKLQHAGYTVLVPANPLRGVASDAAYLSTFLAQRATGPVVLVGHSYGGMVITNAALSDPDVKALVYLDAFAPKQGDSVLSLEASVGVDASGLFDAVQNPGGDTDLYLKQAIFAPVFANGVPARQAAELYASQRPITLSALTEASGPPAWASIPSWYLLGTQDNIIPPALQLSMATAAGSHITEVASGHLSPITHAAAAEKLILQAVRATG
jgi:pimeloyl-ACP methyl ester carboxylesterase